MLSKSKIFKKYFEVLGNSVTINREDGSEIKLFAAIEQTWRKNKNRFEAVASKLGQARNDYYIYIGPYDVDVTVLTNKDIVHCNGSEYYFLNADSVSVGNEIQYYTGVLKRIYEEDDNVFG